MLRKTAVLLIGLVSVPALANEEKGPTFGIGVSHNEYKLNPSQNLGFSGSDNAIGWEVFGGWRFNRYIAAEASYINGGHVRFDVLGARVRLTGKAYGASAVASLPFTDSGFALFARAGFMRGDLEAQAVGPGGSASGKDHDSQPIIGAGMRALVDGAHLRLEYDRIDWDAFDSERISLNVAWLF